MERKHILEQIYTKLAIFETEVRIANSNSEFDINRHAQSMLIPILNIVFGCKFQNLDYAKDRNFPAIDLGAPEKRFAIQVTSNGTTSKIAHSLEMFNKYGLGKDYSDLLFYFIQKPKTAISLSSRSIVKSLGCLEQNNISYLTNDDLYQRLNSFSIDDLQDVLELLQKEYPDIHYHRPSAIALTPLPPYDHEAGLIGRDRILHDIKTALMNSFPVIVLNGPGGIGKTSIAAKLCHVIKAEKSASTAWITYSGDLKNDILKLELYKDSDPAQRQERILDHLKSTTEPLCLFIDNVKTRPCRTDIELINQFTQSVHVIITSRTRISEFQSFRLPALEKDAAVAMYEAYSNYTIPLDEIGAFERLLMHTSSNTLLIELLAKFASRKLLSLHGLIKLLETEGILTIDAGDLDTIYSGSPREIRDFLLELYNISELSPEQKRIMKLLSIFPAERPITLYIAEWANFDMTELHTLSEWGWIKYVTTVSDPNLTADSQLPADDSIPSTNVQCTKLPMRLYLHSIIKDAVSSQSNKQIDFNDYADFMKKVTNTFSYLGRDTSFRNAQIDIIVPEAIADYRLAHKMADQVTADLCLNLSIAFKRNGDLIKAEKYVKKARGIFQKKCGKDSSQTARALKQHAMILSDQGNLGLASLLAQKSLDIRKKLSEPSAEASSYDLLGRISLKAENYKDAQQYFETALSKRGANPNNTDTANTLHNLGLVYIRTGRYDDAITFLKKALAIREKHFDNNHFQTAATLSRLGDAYRSKENYNDALVYYEKAFKIFKELSAVEHPFAESTHFGLGYCHKKLGNMKKSAEAFRAAYRICLAVYGPQHPHTLEAKKQMQ